MGSPYKALVAFTDVVKDAKDGQEYTEAKMNGFPEAGTGDIEKRMKDEVGQLVRRFFQPSTLLSLLLPRHTGGPSVRMKDEMTYER